MATMQPWRVHRSVIQLKHHPFSLATTSRPATPQTPRIGKREQQLPVTVAAAVSAGLQWVLFGEAALFLIHSTTAQCANPTMFSISVPALFVALRMMMLVRACAFGGNYIKRARYFLGYRTLMIYTEHSSEVYVLSTNFKSVECVKLWEEV